MLNLPHSIKLFYPGVVISSLCSFLNEGMSMQAEYNPLFLINCDRMALEFYNFE
jgi:hypothetical protein